MEESQEKCVSGPDQKRRGEENDGETVKWRRRITKKKKHQDVQRNSGGEVCLLFPSTLSTSVFIYYSPALQMTTGHLSKIISATVLGAECTESCHRHNIASLYDCQ